MSDMINEIFDLNGDALRDYSIKSKLLREYRSDANPTDADPNIVINVRDTSEWVCYNSAFLEISGLSTGTGGGGVASNLAGTVSALEAGGASSLFSTARLRVANTLVESNDVYSHYNAFTKQIMTYCDDYARSIAISNGFVLDTAPTADDSQYVTTTVLYGDAPPAIATNANRAITASSVTTANGNYNSGYATRKALFGLTTASKQRQTFYLPLRCLFDFCDVNKVVKGIPLRIELVKRSLSEMIYGTSTEPWFSIDKCSLWMPIITPALPVLAQLESALSKGISLPWSYNNWRTFASDGSLSVDRRYTFNTQSDKPLFAFLYCKIDKDGGVDQKNFNNFSFDHANVNSVQLLVNGARVPYTAYSPSWASGNAQDTTRVYAGLMEYNAKYQGDNDTGSLINIGNHRSLYPYYFFDFGSLEDLPSNGGYQVAVEARLSAAPARNMTMYLTVVSESRWNLVGGEQGLQIIQN